MNCWVITNETFYKDTTAKYEKYLVAAGEKLGIKVKHLTNIDAYFRFIDGEKPDFISFWCKDYKIARFFEKNGIRVFNNSLSIERCDDKAKTYIELLNNNIPQPKSIISPFFFFQEKVDVNKIVDKAIAELGNDIVVKECCSSYGFGVSLVKNKSELKNKIIELGDKPYILQEQIKSSFGCDIKVEIVGDFYCAVKRENTTGDFRACFRVGGKGTPYKLNDKELSLCRKVIKTMGLDFGGVDLLFSENGEPIVGEVNSNSSFLHIDEICNVDIPKEIFFYIKNNYD